MTLVERPKTSEKVQNKPKKDDALLPIITKCFREIKRIEDNNEFNLEQDVIYVVQANHKSPEFSCMVTKSIDLPELTVSEPPEDFIYPKLKEHMDMIGTLSDHNLNLRESSVVFQEPATKITYKQTPIAYYWLEKNCMIVGYFDWHKHYARILNQMLNCLDELSIIKPLR